MYQLYAQDKVKGWITVDKSNDLDELELLAENLTAKECYEYLIVEHRKDGDRTIKRQELYDECEVEYSDDVKVSFEVKATTFVPSRTKQKQELRKETEKYL